MKLPKVLLIGFLIIITTLSAFAYHPQQQISEQPQVVSAVAPVFSPVALAAGESGNVIVEVKIGSDGNVSSARAVDGAKILRISSEIAARRWKFAPDKNQAGVRIARLTFTFYVPDKQLPEAEITPVFVPPYNVKVSRNIPRIEG